MSESDIGVAPDGDPDRAAPHPGAEEARSRRDFLAVVAHELRTPLTAIRGLADLLTQDWDGYRDDEKREFVQRIALAGARLDGLIGDLLDPSPTEPGPVLPGS